MDTIMAIGGVFFFVLFAFLLFIFIIFLFSLIKKTKKFPPFEPKVSIIIPAYNEEESIGECLRSITHLDYPKHKLEILVIDDGSSDDTVAISKKMGAKVLLQSHKGKSAALNLGAKRASHEFLFTLDADTLVEKRCLKELILPFSDPSIGATTGNSRPKKSGSLLFGFQNIEYHSNNLIRRSFSSVFGSGIWFFGALACYRKSALKKIRYFKEDTLAEDMDIALELSLGGYKTFNASQAFGITRIPHSIRELYNQRSRWWVGTLQSLIKNRSLLRKKSSPSTLFLFINQFWWSFYAFLSLPLILYQINYWLPYNTETFSMLFGYLFRWFSLAGPAYVLYMIPTWGLSFYSIFGVLSGILSTIMIVFAIKTFNDRLTFQNLFAIFFYFPYTILLNILIVLSILHSGFLKQKHFIR